MALNEALEALRFDLESYLTGADGREHEAVRTLVGAVDRVRELHKRCDDDPGGPPYCAECTSEYAPWPCATIRALGGS